MSTPARSADPAEGRSSRLPAVALAAPACAFLVLAVLVESGACAAVDRFSVAHLMPGLRPDGPTGAWYDGLYPPFATGTRSLWEQLAGLWLYPCSVFASALLLCAGALILRHRGDERLALVFVGAWATGNAIELLGKGSIRRPALYARDAHGVLLHLRTYDASFPSGHMIRGTVLAALLVALWPRARRLIAVWYLPVGPLLVASAAHTVVDVVGGLLVGLTLFAAVTRFGPASLPRLDVRAQRRASAADARATRV